MFEDPLGDSACQRCSDLTVHLREACLLLDPLHSSSIVGNLANGARSPWTRCSVASCSEERTGREGTSGTAVVNLEVVVSAIAGWVRQVLKARAEGCELVERGSANASVAKIRSLTSTE